MQDKVERLHFLDSMRAILMMLGVVLHSAQIFNPAKTWLIYSDSNSVLMAYIVEIISTFRMPAFFVVSGYFCFLTLKKYKVKKFLSLRLQRLIIPLIVSALLLNSAQISLLSWLGWHQFDLSDYLLTGQYISHLWFLTDLIVYFSVVGLIAVVAEPVARSGVALAQKVLQSIPILILVLGMPLVTVFIFALNKIGFPLYSSFFGVFDTSSILVYSPFFVFGLAIATHKEALRRFSTINPIVCLVAIVVAVSLGELSARAGGVVSVIGGKYFQALAQWFSVLLCFFVFFRYFNKRSRVMLMLSDSSYSVYLFHHVFVISLGCLLIYWSVPAIPAFFILVISVSAITLFIHNTIVQNSKVLRFMFNGK